MSCWVWRSEKLVWMQDKMQSKIFFWKAKIRFRTNEHSITRMNSVAFCLRIGLGLYFVLELALALPCQGPCLESGGGAFEPIKCFEKSFHRKFWAEVSRKYVIFLTDQSFISLENILMLTAFEISELFTPKKGGSPILRLQIDDFFGTRNDDATIEIFSRVRNR